MLQVTMQETTQYVITTAKLVPYPKRAGNVVSLANAWHHEASASDAKFGDICAVTEVLAPNKQASEVTDLIIGSARKHYYESTSPDTSVRFEETVKAVNQELASYATRGNSAWIGKVSAVIAVVTGQEVHITQTGSAQAYLYRRGHGTCITSGLGTKEPHRPSKTFGNIASGIIQPGDRLLLATPALFHQLSGQELSDIVSDHSATLAVSKLQQLLGKTEAQERIAVTISEVTTAEAAAMTAQTGLPKEAHIGKPENFATNAHRQVAPLAKTAAGFMGSNWTKLKAWYQSNLIPFSRAATLALVRWLRKTLSSKTGRIGFSLSIVVILVGIVWLIGHGGNNKALANLSKQYKDALTKETTASGQLAAGNKLGAKSNYQASLDELTSLLKKPKANQLDAYLAKHPHSDDDPLSGTKLRDLDQAQIDQIDGLTRVGSGQLADFSALGNAHPTLMEQVGSQFIFVDPSAGSSIYRYDLTKAKLDVVADHPTKLGKVVALAASSDESGVYLLTDQPSVWFYSTSSASLTQLQVSDGSWPKGQAISSYNTNLYILAADDSALYKLVKTQTGFGAPASYSISDTSVLKGATSLAIDGNIYIGNNQGFTRILAGVVENTDLSFPASLLNPRTLVSVDQGKLIIETDAKSNRIGLFSFNGTLQYSKQLAINDASTVYKASASTEDNTLYALVDQKFVKINY